MSHSEYILDHHGDHVFITSLPPSLPPLPPLPSLLVSSVSTAELYRRSFETRTELSSERCGVARRTHQHACEGTAGPRGA